MKSLFIASAPSAPFSLFGIALLAVMGCSNGSKIDAQTGAAPSSTVQTVTPTALSTPSVSAAAPGAPVNVITDTPSPSWDDIKSLTYEQHEPFSSGLLAIENRLDRQIGALNTKRSQMTSDTKDWDFDMKEVNESRQYLTWLNEEVSKAGPDTWQQEKDKVEQALVRAQNAIEKVKDSTTS